MKFSSFLLTCLLISTACSKVDNLEKRIKKVENTTKEISDSVEKKEEAVTTSNTETTREDKFQILMDEEAGFSSRVSAAESYLKSFGKESQIDFVTDFTRKLSDLYTKISVRKLKPTTKNKYEQSFYALAVSLHVNETYHDLVARSKSEESISLYSLIESALLKEKEGKVLKQHEELLVMGENREMIIELLKARVDMMSAYALKNLTDKESMNLRQKVKAFIFKVTGGKLGSIDLPEVYDKSNEATKVYTEKYLDAAVKTRAFLKKIDIEKKLEKSLASAYKGIDLNEGSQELKADAHRADIRRHIDDLIN